MKTLYIIQALALNSLPTYVKFDENGNPYLVTTRQEASGFESQVLARGWMSKAVSMMRGYRFSIVTL